MSNTTIPDRYNEQFERLLIGPTRAFFGLGVEHMEKLTSVQLEATKAYTELGFRQLRAALEIREPKDLESYAQGQQEAVKTLGERVKGDAEKVVALNREFAEKAQQLAQENASGFAKTAARK
ncbi:MAG: phasin family protein [Nitrococcus sp.]|nr:phasin family protein [Nitrococcus sp.]